MFPTTRTRLRTAIAKSTFTRSSRPTKRSINFMLPVSVAGFFRPAIAATTGCGRGDATPENIPSGYEIVIDGSQRGFVNIGKFYKELNE